VTLADTWVQVPLEATSDETVAALKARVLAAARIPPDQAGQFEVKLGGALVRDESQSLAAAGAPDGGALIVLRRRRRAVR
jgi:hypothetical protein